MKKIIFLWIICLVTISLSTNAQNFLPKSLTKSEEAILDKYLSKFSKKTATNPPDFPVRTMAEWEEIKAITLSWQGYSGILTEIVREAVEEVEVIIFTSNINNVENTLINAGVNTDQVTYINQSTNSIWIRDYGGNTVYKDYVDSLILVDWIYNRSRPLDNNSPAAIGSFKGIPVYEMSQSGTDLVHTGGNFMADGFGTGFSSELVDDENSSSGSFNLTNKTPAQVDQLMLDWMGIDPYIKMPVLPYDDIHHIDMHMKLINEETLLVGEFPVGVSDGPQIEMNLQYIQDNFTSVFGTPYKIVRIPMVPTTSGGYPNGSWSGPPYRTYANNLIVNKKVLVPTYRTEYDTIGLRIIREAMPGYEVVGIDCDDFNANIISLGGAIHCITKEIGASDPLLISHQQLANTTDNLNPYTVEAIIMHKSGIANAQIHYKTDLDSTFNTTSMVNISNDLWSGDIPSQVSGSIVEYFISATANNSKNQLRPITAPDGFFSFNVTGFVDVLNEEITFSRVFPNPSKGLTCIEINNPKKTEGKIELYDIMGRKMESIHKGVIKPGKRKFFIDLANYKSGAYLIVMEFKDIKKSFKVFIN